MRSSVRAEYLQPNFSTESKAPAARHLYFPFIDRICRPAGALQMHVKKSTNMSSLWDLYFCNLKKL